MNIVTIQLAVEEGKNKHDRLEQVDGFLNEISKADNNPDLILLPELWGCGFFNFDQYVGSAEDIEGETYQLLSKWAKEIGCYILGGSIVEKDETALYNTALFINKDGELVSTYRKHHLFGYQSKEQQILNKGKRIVVANTEFGKIGFSTCYDLRFCEQYREMIDQGAEIFLIVSAWPKARLNHWRLFNQVRALENQCWLISCNCVGIQEGNQYAGHSMAVSPWGEIAFEAEEVECINWFEIDLKEINEARNKFPALADR